jgi:hydrogenase small subunit
MKVDRRTFLKDAAVLVAGMGLSPVLKPRFAEALEQMASARAPILWLQGQSCSGCSVSLLNSESPGPADLVTRYLSLYFHQTISAATGGEAREAVEAAIGAGGYVLVVEGAVPLAMPEACEIGEEHFDQLVARAARKAKAVVAVGSCASFGGIPSAYPNPTGAASAQEALRVAGVTTPVVNLPGCPAHPAWIVGNLVYLLKVGAPELDEHQRPVRTYGKLLHDQCPHFAQYERHEFAEKLGEEGCLFKIGCQGVVTHSDCSYRGWNGGVNWCVRSRAPCVGCARPEFAKDPAYVFYRLNEEGFSS